MTADKPVVTIHMVSSLDFFIESEDGSTDWLETEDLYEGGVTGDETEGDVSSIGCFVLGSRTYELALRLGWPYGDVPTIVLTNRELTSDRDSVSFYSGDLKTLVEDQLKPKYATIWMVGGAMLARDFIRANLADEIRISILPIILGGGKPFLENLGRQQPLHLRDVKAYRNGIVALWYDIRRA
jgi:dihydrofolate reductase